MKEAKTIDKKKALNTIQFVCICESHIIDPGKVAEDMINLG